MNKNNFAPLPPMGWNSYDYYDTTVTEDAVKANANYMAAHLKDFGWEYIVVDIEWYAIGACSMRDKFQYIPFADVAMDEFSILQQIGCVSSERLKKAVKCSPVIALCAHQMAFSSSRHT